MKKIEILGTGCAKCTMLYEITCNALLKGGFEAQVIKIDDPVTIMMYSVMTTPALAVEGKVLFTGKIPSTDELVELLRPYL